MGDPHVAWKPKRFLLPEDEMMDALCISAILANKRDGTYYDERLIRAVTIETTWAMFIVIHKRGGVLPPHKSTE
jgi:hypothetical protein